MNRKKLLRGVMVNDLTVPTNNIIEGKRKQRKYYTDLQNMLKRCYSAAYQRHTNVYDDVTVCDEWLASAEAFRKWHGENYVEGWELDKDILAPGNREYSPEACVFVPPEVNRFLSNMKSFTPGNIAGVAFNANTGLFEAKAVSGGQWVRVGSFRTEMGAFMSLMSFRRSLVPALLAPYRGLIDSRVEAGLYGNLMLVELEGYRTIAERGEPRNLRMRDVHSDTAANAAVHHKHLRLVASNK